MTDVSLSRSSFTLLRNTHKKSISTYSILVDILVTFLFRLVGLYCSVALSLNQELGKVKYCTIENHLYLWLALCVSTSSTGTLDTSKNASNTDKRITSENKTLVQQSKKSVFCAQYNSRWMINGSSTSNQLHWWVINRPQNFWASITHRLQCTHWSSSIIND